MRLTCAKNPTAGRMVKCVFCPDLIPLALAMQTRGVCRLCIAEIDELHWRVVYDREQQLGEIPANLKAAYRL
jgi:hypothetical protein